MTNITNITKISKISKLTQDQEAQLYIKKAFTLFTLGKSLYKDQMASSDSKLNKPDFNDIVSLNSLLTLWNKGLIKSEDSKKLLKNYLITLGIDLSQQPDIESISFEAIEDHMVAELYLNNRTKKLKKQAA